MKKYKIKVSNEAESKEAKELFLKLGYKLLINQAYAKYLYVGDSALNTGYGTDDDVFKCERHQEITLPQLYDLVVLHHNNINDATHTWANNKYYIGDKVYYWLLDEWTSCSDGVQYALENYTPTCKNKESKKFEAKWESTPFGHLQYTLVRTQEQFNSLYEMTHDTSNIDMTCCNASAILYDSCAVVFVGDIDSLDKVRQIGIIFHEAIHIWQHLKEKMGEESPSVEFEAYSIQKIGEDLLNMFNESIK